MTTCILTIRFERFLGWAMAGGLCLAMVMGSTGCKKKKPTEQQRYRKIQKGFKFRAYKNLSGKALPPLVKLYNSRAKEGDKVSVFLCRLVLGYGWMVNSKSELTIAEGLLITEDRSTTKFGRALGHLLLSIGMHGAGLKTLATREKDKAGDAIGTENQRKQTDAVLAVGYALLAVHALREKQYGPAIVFLRGFDTVTGIGWPVPLVEVIKDIQDKKYQRAMIRAKKLSKDEQVPAPIRAELASMVAAMEKKGGPVESQLFLPRLMSRLLFEELRKSKKLAGAFSVTDNVRNRASSLRSVSVKKKTRSVLKRIFDWVGL
jgi:hypothetical protein